jgi:hypothetical protein
MHGNTARSDISDPGSDISDQPDLSGLHQVLEPWQLPRLHISNHRSDISDPSDLSGLHWVPVPCHPPQSDISDLAKVEPF